MSLILAGLVFAGTSGALLLGRLLGRRAAAAGPDAAPESAPDAAEEDAKKEVEAGLPPPSADTVPSEPKAPARRVARAQPTATKPGTKLPGFACQLGDVVLRVTGEEAWLAGAVVLSEEVPVAVLFVAPDAGHDVALWVRPAPKATLWWLEPLEPSAILVGGEPPSAVEHDRIRFERTRKLPLRPRRIGVGAPELGDAVVIAEYASAGDERLLVAKANSGVVHAYRGRALDPSAFEVIASGDATLE